MEQMKFDIDHWNADHPNEEPIVINYNLTDDIQRLRSKKEGGAT
jgi:hypothetical protein